MTRFWRWTLVALAAIIGLGALLVMHMQGPQIESIGQENNILRSGSASPGLCPWRQPQADMKALFPGADHYQTKTLFLTGLRLQILQRLGRGSELGSNVLYVYPVWQKFVRRGEVLVDRTPGEYGAIEVVVGVDTTGHVTGVRLQRLREPSQIAKAITSPQWLNAFRGKTANSRWRLGKDLPGIPAAASISAESVVRAVSTLLIEADIAERTLKTGK